MQLTDELVFLTTERGEIIVGQFAPPLFHQTLRLFPFPLNCVGIHQVNSFPSRRSTSQTRAYMRGITGTSQFLVEKNSSCDAYSRKNSELWDTHVVCVRMRSCCSRNCRSRWPDGAKCVTSTTWATACCSSRPT